MGLDIRLPIGLMFSLFGAVLLVYGLLSDKSLYQRSLGINVNVDWGAVLLVFGVVMLLLGRRNKAEPANANSAEQTSTKDGDQVH
jgi:multisubunit Na+/H+ antiporter MnhG subunit